MKWRLVVLLLLLAAAFVAQSLTWTSEDYNTAALVAGAALGTALVLTYLWWKLMTALVKVLVRAALFLLALGLAVQFVVPLFAPLVAS